jgi:hypothetical protein
MNRLILMFRCKWLYTTTGAALIATMASCLLYEESGLPGSASSMAHNQMMAVRQNPPTFGHYRITMLMQQHPDLEAFVRARGMPDFLAETSSDGRHYHILYYLGKRQAFACRTRAERQGSLEFAGPYPITRSERQILRGLLDDGTVQP